MTDTKLMTVRDVMKTDFHLIDGKATVSEAIQMMKKNKHPFYLLTNFTTTMNTASSMLALSQDLCSLKTGHQIVLMSMR
jgi:CBS domain.